MKRNMGVYHRRKVCRVCNSKNLFTFLDYGNIPLAGGFLLPEEIEDTKLYPMDLSVCFDCSLVQILNVVAPDILFTDYRYLSSITQTLSQHFRDYAQLLYNNILPRDNPFLVEIGCNDGVLLEPLKKLGVKTLGIDAAENVVQVAKKRGLDVIHGYFDVPVAEQIVTKYGKPYVITASNVFAHIDDLDEVMCGVNTLLDPDGFFIVEVHYIVDLLQTFQFDTVYHEHLCYYSLHALQTLYERFGFKITNVQDMPMHGGAIRVFAKRLDFAQENNLIVNKMLEREQKLGINKSETYVRFGQQVMQYRNQLQELISKRKRSGHSISAYGAAGRATTLLNYCQFGPDIIEYVVDESPFRYGRYVPGVLLPIVQPSTLTENPTDDCLITAWNYRDEIINKEEEYLANGGCFVIPLPKIEVIQK